MSFVGHCHLTLPICILCHLLMFCIYDANYAI